VGPCWMPGPTTAVFIGRLGADRAVPLGKHRRYFGDGFLKSKRLEGIRYWRIPTMEGEFVVEESLGVEKGVAGGNLVLQATELGVALLAARDAVEAVAPLAEVITPFPGGVVRSGSKVGSRYEGLRASTADAFCPTLRGRVESKLHPAANVALEIVINGTDANVVGDAMATAIGAAAGEGVVCISAGNYGGNLGPFKFELHQLLSASA
ncbi:MAG: formylmethanofuran--tetrahydromethanopterin N-formyltransferase, partial [Planctomycetota bacterium]